MVQKNDRKLDLKCVSLKGELSYLGKHIYYNDLGVTLCGCFTVDYNKEEFKNMPEGVTSEYRVEEWDITCERCLNMIDIFKKIKPKQ